MRFLAVGLFLFGLCQAVFRDDSSSDYDMESESVSEENPVYSEQIEKKVQERLQILKNNGGEGEDTYNTYKSVCIVDGQPKLLDMFDCRKQVAVGRWQNSINSTGFKV